MEDKNIKFVQSLLDSICEKFKIRFYKLEMALQKKNLLYFEFTTEILTIIDLLKTVGNVEEKIFQNFFEVLDKLVLEHIKPKLEDYYACKVRQIFFLPRERNDMQEKGTVVVIFAKDIQNEKNVFAEKEDTITREISKKLKETSHRGSKKTRSYILNESKVLFLFEGFFSKTESDFVQRQEASLEGIPKFIEHVLLTVAKNMATKERQVINEKAIFDMISDMGLLVYEYKSC